MSGRGRVPAAAATTVRPGSSSGIPAPSSVPSGGGASGSSIGASSSSSSVQAYVEKQRVQRERAAQLRAERAKQTKEGGSGATERAEAQRQLRAQMGLVSDDASGRDDGGGAGGGGGISAPRRYVVDDPFGPPPAVPAVRSVLVAGAPSGTALGGPTAPASRLPSRTTTTAPAHPHPHPQPSVNPNHSSAPGPSRSFSTPTSDSNSGGFTTSSNNGDVLQRVDILEGELAVMKDKYRSFEQFMDDTKRELYDLLQENKRLNQAIKQLGSGGAGGLTRAKTSSPSHSVSSSAPSPAHNRRPSNEQLRQQAPQPQSSPTSSSSSNNNFEDQPIRQSKRILNSSSNSFDDQPIGGGSKSQPVTRGGGNRSSNGSNFDELQLKPGAGGGGADGGYDIDSAMQGAEYDTAPAAAAKPQPPVTNKLAAAKAKVAARVAAPVLGPPGELDDYDAEPPTAATKKQTASRPNPNAVPAASLDDMPVGGRSGGGGEGDGGGLDDMPVGGGSGPSPFGVPEFADGGDGGEDDGGEVEGEKFPCPTCSRKFNEQALKKHAKICKKVFVQKRKAFDMKSQRLTEEASEVFAQQPKAKGGKAKPTEPQKKEGEIPKWKVERQRLQEAIQAGKALQQAVAEGRDIATVPVAVSAIPDSRTECPHCGRKFNEDVAKRHMPACKNTKAKPNAVKKK